MSMSAARLAMSNPRFIQDVKASRLLATQRMDEDALSLLERIVPNLTKLPRWMGALSSAANSPPDLKILRDGGAETQN